MTDGSSANHQMRSRAPAPAPSAARRAGAARSDADAGSAGARFLLLQRAAGNRATRQLFVQRCGATPPDQCDCHGSDGAGHAPAGGGPNHVEAPGA